MLGLLPKVILSASLPVALAATTLILTFMSTGPDAQFFLRLAITFLITAVLFGVVTWNAHRTSRLEERVRDLDSDVHSRLVVKKWRRDHGDAPRANPPREES